MGLLRCLAERVWSESVVCSKLRSDEVVARSRAVGCATAEVSGGAGAWLQWWSEVFAGIAQGPAVCCVPELEHSL